MTSVVMWGCLAIYFLCVGLGTSETLSSEGKDEPVADEPVELEGRKVVSGATSNVDDSPYEVSFKVDNVYYCGGVLVGEKEIVSPAHCTYGVTPERVLVRAGSSFVDRGGITVPASKVVTHPGYNNPAFDKDVGYIITAEPLVYSKSIQPIALPPRDRPLTGRVTVTGWGRKGEVTEVPSTVMKSLAWMMDEMKCRSYYPNLMTRNTACSSNFFLSHGDICQRNTEGTAIQDGMAVGLVTFSGACGDWNSPSVFADLAAPDIRDFLSEHLGL